MQVQQKQGCEMEQKTLKTYIVATCKANNISVAYLAERSSISKSTFYQMMNHNKSMSIKTYFALCSALGEICLYPEQHYLQRIKQYIEKEQMR